MIKYYKNESGREYTEIFCDCGSSRFIRNYYLDKFKNWKCRKCKSVKHVGTPIHNSYKGAKQRCVDKNHVAYNNYGGRGIKFEWESFESFYLDMANSWFPNSSLDRINNNGNYCKENCKWSTRTEQNRNSRRNIHTEEDVDKIRSLYLSGEKTQVELSEIYNDSQGNISNPILKRTWK